MSRISIRDFHDDDLDGVVRLWEKSDLEAANIYSPGEVVASCQADHAVVAVAGDRVVGAAVGRAALAQGWIVFFHVDADDAHDRIAASLLDELQRQVAPLGLRKLSILISDDARKLGGLAHSGFEAHGSVRYLERRMPVQRRELDLLKDVGGRLMPRDLWEGVSGMQREKQLLEDRLVAPLANPELADRFGVVPPHAVMLFGPPGTGKTTFAKAVASRLDWPFVELFPSRLAGSSDGLAAALRHTFDTLGRLEHAVVFIDEVEEIASRRGGDPPSPTQGVTNELLKLIAEFRERDGRLLICATNFVRALDDAFLRHGRFDYVIPIGLPDDEARRAIWARYVPEHVRHEVALESLVDASGGLTPADIEYAARRASQVALARSLDPTISADSVPDLSTGDYLQALSVTRATVSPDAAHDFSRDITAFERL